MPKPLAIPRNLRWRPCVEREFTALCACVLLLVLSVAQLDPGIDLADAHGSAPALRVLALNLLPALTGFALVLALSRRLLLSAWLLLLTIAGLYGANAAKLGALQMPLLPADLRLFIEPRPALQLFSHYVRVDLLHGLLIVVGVGITFTLLRERPLRLLDPRRRLLMGATALLAGTTLYAGAQPWRELYRSAERDFQPWALEQTAMRTGLLGSLLLYHWEIGSRGIPAADRAAAVALLQAHAPELRAGLALSSTLASRPDIVVVQSESLFDPARMRGVLSDRWLPRYHALRKRGQSGELTVPTFAGGTIRTEFEVLTGAPLTSLGGIQYPWLELDQTEYPGLTQVLETNGYATTALHPNAAAFWNRDKVFPALGFERFLDAGAFPLDRIVGLFTADAALTERILAELANEGPPQFLFAISMENHGPFDWRPNLDAQRLAALPMPEGLDEGSRLWLRNYLYLLDDADTELGRLAKALAKRKRHTLLLFYGDHLPDLGPVYAELGFDDGGDAKAQSVPWLLLDNRNPRARRSNLHAFMLPARLLETAGIRDGAWFDILTTLTHSPDFSFDDPPTRAGLDALAQLHLHGELNAVLDDTFGLAAVEPQ